MMDKLKNAFSTKPQQVAQPQQRIEPTMDPEPQQAAQQAQPAQANNLPAVSKTMPQSTAARYKQQYDQQYKQATSNTVPQFNTQMPTNMPTQATGQQTTPAADTYNANPITVKAPQQSQPQQQTQAAPQQVNYNVPTSNVPQTNTTMPTNMTASPTAQQTQQTKSAPQPTQAVAQSEPEEPTQTTTGQQNTPAADDNKNQPQQAPQDEPQVAPASQVTPQEKEPGMFQKLKNWNTARKANAPANKARNDTVATQVKQWMGVAQGIDPNDKEGYQQTFIQWAKQNFPSAGDAVITKAAQTMDPKFFNQGSITQAIKSIVDTSMRNRAIGKNANDKAQPPQTTSGEELPDLMGKNAGKTKAKAEPKQDKEEPKDFSKSLMPQATSTQQGAYSQKAPNKMLPNWANPKSKDYVGRREVARRMADLNKQQQANPYAQNNTGYAQANLPQTAQTPQATQAAPQGTTLDYDEYKKQKAAAAQPQDAQARLQAGLANKQNPYASRGIPGMPAPVAAPQNRNFAARGIPGMMPVAQTESRDFGAMIWRQLRETK